MKPSKEKIEHYASDLSDCIIERIEQWSDGLLTEGQWEKISDKIIPGLEDILDQDFPDHIPSVGDAAE